MVSPYFSIVIPVYDRADTIVPTLQSVLAQTFEDYECIIVDDGSKDSRQLKTVVERLADPRFRYLWRENGGGGAARNTGIDAARGAYIAFLDSDDFFLPDKLARDQKLIGGLTQERTVIFSQVIVDRGGEKHWTKPGRGPDLGEDISEYLMCRQGFVQTSTIVISADFAKRIRYDENLAFSQDADFAIRAATVGALFIMHDTPTAVWMDIDDPGRLSLKAQYGPAMEWIERIRPHISERAYYCYRGRQVARLTAPSNLLLALRFYFDALLRGAFPPRLALTALAQIVIPVKIYRQLANLYISRFGNNPS